MSSLLEETVDAHGGLRRMDGTGGCSGPPAPKWRLLVGAGDLEVDALDVLIDVAGMSPDLLGTDGLAALEESHG